MSQSRSYKIAAAVHKCAAVLGLSPARILARVGLPTDTLLSEVKGVNAATYFELWRACEAEFDEIDMPLRVGVGAARGPMHPALLAFSASPDIHAGFSRLSVFKPLVAPVSLQIEDSGDEMHVSVTASDRNLRMPGVLAAAEIVFFLDFARVFSAHSVCPLRVEIPDLSYATPAYRDFVGGAITWGPIPRMTLSQEDAHRPLISADTQFYELIEREMMSQLRADASDGAMAERVRQALIDLMPSGSASADAVCARLGTSKRSLQRRLKEEGTSFQAVLEETRASLSLRYLRDQQHSAEEVSYLLAYRDPNSFYRAFHSWTGMTPAQARNTVVLPQAITNKSPIIRTAP